MRLLLALILLCFGTLSAHSFQKEPSADMKIISFNIRYGTPGDGEHIWKKRRNMVYTVFKKYEAGIVAVQEALPMQIREILKNNKEFDVVYRTRMSDTERGEATAIFYKKSAWRVIEHQTYWLSDTPEVPQSRSYGNSLPRIYTVALMRHKQSGKRIRVVNTHYDHRSQESRIKSNEQIFAKLDSYNDEVPTIFLGDFNVQPDNEVYTNILTRFEDSYKDDPLEGCTFHNFAGGRHCKRIDFVFFEADKFELVDSEIIRYGTGRRFPSDHYPISASFNFR